MNVKKVLKIVGIVVGAFILFFIGAGIGSSGAEITVHNKSMDITQLDTEISKLKGNKDNLSKDVKSLQKEKEEAQALINKKDSVAKELTETEAKLKDKKAELDKELADGRKDIETKLADAKKELSDAQSKANDAQGQLKDIQDKIASATGQLQKAEGAPKTLGAGEYIVGKDIPEGRYTAHALGRGSNFFVYDGSGIATVNTILGDSSVGSGDYTFFCSNGDLIKTHESVSLTPMK